MTQQTKKNVYLCHYNLTIGLLHY